MNSQISSRPRFRVLRRRRKTVLNLLLVSSLLFTTAEAEKTFETQITRCYEGVPSHLGKLVYTARKSPPVHHYAICQDRSPAGETFNHSNFRLLLDHLEHAKKLPERIVLQELITTKFDDFIPRFFLKAPLESKVEYREHETEERMETISEETDLEQGDRNYQRLGCFRIDCEKLEVKRQGVLSEQGEVTSFDITFNPNPAVFDKKLGDGYLWRTIQIECPGVREEQVQWEQTGDGLKVKIEKSTLVDEGAVIPMEGYPLRQQSGRWQKTFEFRDGPFELIEEECSLQYGVLRLILKKSLVNKCGGLRSFQASQVKPAASPLPSSLPSEAGGACQAQNPDAHPSAQESAAMQSGLAADLGNHCLTSTSWILTDEGPRSAVEVAKGEVASVTSVALEPEATAECPEPKNGSSPA
ncbi:unnamed protein product [Durusdinium trenchii]|uniref:Uncharacterized protein n=2 Tax=Durusdinium trenchii TaxID=1381693 RepID=A0ABP0MG79_9DINO